MSVLAMSQSINTNQRNSIINIVNNNQTITASKYNRQRGNQSGQLKQPKHQSSFSSSNTRNNMSAEMKLQSLQPFQTSQPNHFGSSSFSKMNVTSQETQTELVSTTDISVNTIEPVIINDNMAVLHRDEIGMQTEELKTFDKQV
jgi:hypothetical protein